MKQLISFLFLSSCLLSCSSIFKGSGTPFEQGNHIPKSSYYNSYPECKKNSYSYCLILQKKYRLAKLQLDLEFLKTKTNQQKAKLYNRYSLFYLHIDDYLSSKVYIDKAYKLNSNSDIIAYNRVLIYTILGFGHKVQSNIKTLVEKFKKNLDIGNLNAFNIITREGFASSEQLVKMLEQGKVTTEHGWEILLQNVARF